MTAVHLFATETAAIIATDSAAFNEDGTIAGFMDKHVGADEMRISFAISGRGNVAFLCDEMRKLLPRGGNQSDWLRIMPPALRSMRERWRRELPDGELQIFEGGIGRNDIAVFIAMFTDDGPRLLILATCPRADLGAPVPYEYGQTAGVVQPAVDVAAVLPHGYWRGPRDSRAIFQAQRKSLFEAHGSGAVGGACRMTILTRDGVTHKKIWSWPDKVGERIGA